MVVNRKTKSSYEKAVLLELRLGRWSAWLTYLASAGVAAAYALGVGVPRVRLARFVAAEAVLLSAAAASAGCEYRAEKQLKDIHDAQAN